MLVNASFKYGVALFAALTMFGAAARAEPINFSTSLSANGITLDTFTLPVTSQGNAFPTQNIAGERPASSWGGPCV
jgi:energy-converting hydrogenase Eha subunit H